MCVFVCLSMANPAFSCYTFILHFELVVSVGIRALDIAETPPLAAGCSTFHFSLKKDLSNPTQCWITNKNGARFLSQYYHITVFLWPPGERLCSERVIQTNRQEATAAWGPKVVDEEVGVCFCVFKTRIGDHVCYVCFCFFIMCNKVLNQEEIFCEHLFLLWCVIQTSGQFWGRGWARWGKKEAGEKYEPHSENHLRVKLSYLSV